MSGFETGTNEHLIRSNLWSKQLKSLLMDDLLAMQFVRVITDFPDGSTINIPSIGEAETADFAEGQAIKYNKFDTGNFTFSFTQYKYSANAISEKFKRDSFYSDQVISAFLPRQHRALMEAVETRILSRGNAGQTPSALNTINGANHRFVASGTSQSLALADVAKAWYALKKANVPMTNLVAIVDPSVAYTLQTQTNITNLMSPAPMWQEVVRSGMVTGMKFQFNLYGFDFYVSNYLPAAGSTGNGSETINGVAVSSGIANMFFSAQSNDVCPFIGGFRQMPTVYSEFNKDLQQTEYLTIAEYDFALFRPENMVIVLTSTAVIS